MDEISAAAGEQANGIDEMSQAVAHMDEMTQQNAALAEESAASAESLSGQIQRLNELVAAFRTRNNGAAQLRSAQGGFNQVGFTQSRAAEPPRPVRAEAPSQAESPATEPARLRKLAQDAFSRIAGPKKTARAPAPQAVRPQPARAAPVRAARAQAVRDAAPGSGSGWASLPPLPRAADRAPPPRGEPHGHRASARKAF